MSENRLLLHQLILVQRQTPTTLTGSSIVAVGLIVIVWRVVPGVYLASWAVLIFSLIFARVAFYVHVKRTGLEDALSFRAAQFVAFSLCSGIAWGAAGALFFTPSEPLTLALLLLSLAGLVAASVASTSAYPPIFFVYSIPALVPIAVTSLMFDQLGVKVMGIFTLVFLAANFAYCLAIHKSIVEALTLRFENIELVEAVSAQKAVAERANIAKSKFLAAASHDLRQPLHAQGLLLDALKAEVASRKGQELLVKILNAKSSLDNLFDGLLDISRLDANVVQPKLEVFNVRSVLTALEEEFERQAEDKGLSLCMESEDVYVRTDKLLLGRIVRNLLSNAIQYTDSGDICLRAKTKNGRARIEVIDTGRGIPQAELANVFSEYHQLTNPERDRNKGLGLGLAIVDKLAKLLGIEIAVSSREFNGSTFTLELDQCEASPNVQRHGTPLREPAERIKLLAIDDSQEVLEGMQELFDQWGYRSILASSAAEAVEQLARLGGDIDVVVADYRLRNNRTGVEAIDRIREEFNLDVPGIIITGDTAPERIVDAERSGYRLLHKPVSAAELRTAIHHELIERT